MMNILEQHEYKLCSENGYWHRAGYGGIEYSDGDENETHLRNIIDSAQDITVLSTELRQHCTDWFKMYHLSGKRANILRPLTELLCGDVLEIGAGCGAITRYLGESGNNVLALEGSPRRAGIARARTRDLNNVTVVAERFDDFRCDYKFDVITLIGVLEYANRFTNEENAASAMLRRARSMLKPDGRLIIAIENQLGLKYFAGAPEDHLGQPMYGVEGRYSNNQPQTFGRKVLSDLLEGSGYPAFSFLAAFPDYKLPISIVTEEGMKTAGFDAAAFAWQSALRDPQLPEYCCFSLELAWPEIFRNGLALDLANSFLIVASPKSQHLIQPGILAYHYSSDRIPQYAKQTIFLASTSNTFIEVKYKLIGLPEGVKKPSECSEINFELPDSAPYTPGIPLSWHFIKIVTRDGWTLDEVVGFVQRYVEVLEQLSDRSLTFPMHGSSSSLPGSFFDAVPQNIMIREDGSPVAIDGEWSLGRDIELSHLLFRALMSLTGSVTRFGHNSEGLRFTNGGFIFKILSLYNSSLSEDDIDRFLKHEVSIQDRVTGQSSSGYFYHWKNRLLKIHNLGFAILDRENQIGDLGQVVTEQLAQIENLRKLVAERDIQVAQIDQLVAERDKQNAIVVARQHSSFTYRLRRSLAVMKWRKSLAESPLFNAEWYLWTYPDVASAGMDPLKHYLTSGWREGRRPGPEFDNAYYVDRYQDIKHLNMPPLVHYFFHGRFEGRFMNAAFDIEWRPADAATSSVESCAVNVAVGAGSNLPLISVIIPTYNRIKLLPTVVDSWREVHACTKIDYEIIFSDDGSEDGSAEFLESVRDLPIKVLRNTHGGASSARNAAIRFATGERLLIIGDDIFPDPEILNVHAQLGAKLGDMVATLGSVDWHEALPINHLMRHITEIGNEQFSYNRLQDGGYVDFRHFYTCNICVPRHFFATEQVVFDERFDEYGFEDIELGYRLALRGLKIYFTTAATGEHFHPYSTANFCRRQTSAGRMAVVFAGMHPGVGQLIGVTDDVRHAEAQDTFWQARVDLLLRRCDEYEHLITSLPQGSSAGLRDCLSMLYTRLFRAMYQYGVLQKQGRSSNPLTLVMTDHFSGLSEDYWSMLAAHAGKLMRLSADETCNLGETLMTGRAEDLLFGQAQSAAFEELVLIRELGVQAGGAWAPNRFRYLLSRGFHLLFRNPRYLLARIRDMLTERYAVPRGMPLPVINKPLLVAIPGLVIDADNEHRLELITASRAVFGDLLQVYELAAGGLLARLDDTGRLTEPKSPEDVKATLFFWPASTRFMRCPDRLLSAYMAVIENGLGMAVISHSLDAREKVMVGAWRDHVVFSRALAHAVLVGNTSGSVLTGKILRLLPAWGGEQEHGLNSLLGQEVAVSEDGFFSTQGSHHLTHVRYRPHYLAAREKIKQVVFVFPIFLAVGGVERNTVEIMRELRDRFDFVVITMERLRAEQGSLAGQALEVAARVIEMSEIVRHEHYLRVLSRLKVNLLPDLVWVCNGSPWFCDNAAAIRRIFNDIPIIDQEAYDVEQGWINRYGESGIRSFDHFIAINKKIETRFLSDFGIERKRVHPIYSAIDTVRIRRFKTSRPGEAELREKYGLPVAKRLFSFVGRLTPQKRPVEFLTLALQRIRSEDEFFVLVGDGELAWEVEAFISQHGLLNVKRIPYIANTLELNAISSGIIFTSAYEGLPIAMLEAISLGVPCFATDVGDIADVLHEYNCGEVFPVTMPADDLAVAFECWLARREEYASCARMREEDILERFSSRNIAEQYVACWQAAMAEYKGTTS